MFNQTTKEDEGFVLGLSSHVVDVEVVGDTNEETMGSGSITLLGL